jgi:hypothetical protein
MNEAANRGGLLIVKASVVWRSRQGRCRERCNRNEYRARYGLHSGFLLEINRLLQIHRAWSARQLDYRGKNRHGKFRGSLPGRASSAFIKVRTKSSLLLKIVKAPEPRSSKRLNPKNRSKNAARPDTSEVVRLRCLSCIAFIRPSSGDWTDTKTSTPLESRTSLFTTHRER